jgi:MFS family permease
MLTRLDFGNPQGSLKGIIAAAYSLGAIVSLPFIPMVDNRFGRRGSIMYGSIIMIIGALIQGFAQNGMSSVDATS